uniref:NTF2-related export protein n=1 Tax=Gouania willdenowi TaxID=441366 RepID=A0A8C5DA01_GOUWI
MLLSKGTFHISALWNTLSITRLFCPFNKRRNLTHLYLDEAALVSGQEALTEFIESLPSSKCQVQSLDCQPVNEQASQGQTTLLVAAGGNVMFERNKSRFFNRNFLLTAQASPNNNQPVWKIASDCFRFRIDLE